MKKFFIFFLYLAAFSCFSLYLNAQTLELYTTSGNLLQYGDTITVSGTPQSSELIGHVHVKNISSNTIQVSCTKSYLYIVPGSSNTFCWANNCYPPNTFTSPMKTIAPQEIVTDFSGDYYPTGNAGISYIRYTFNVYHGDSAWIVIKYDATGSGINSYNFAKLSTPYPNPANSVVNVPYYLSSSQKGSIEIYDMIGKLKTSIALNPKQNMITIPVNAYNNGIYFLQLKVNGNSISTEKIIVKH
ncbi:MAG: T9SS type A sorting domain-containing protein [Bacteroidales bacterium]|nr:T9SS type A sorting domain-containing protein [Bacteroidales bacterium]